MTNQIKITMPEVSSTSANMRNLNAQLDETLNSILHEMNELSSVWQSDSSNQIISKFKGFANRFTLESETIEEYCKFLDLTVNTYGSLESTITGNANNFE